MKKLMAVLLAAAMAFSLTACGGNNSNTTTAGTEGQTTKEEQAKTEADTAAQAEEQTEAAGQPKAGSTLKMGMSVECMTAAAWRIRSNQETVTWGLVYEPLIKLDDAGNPVGYLAKSLEGDKENLTYTVTLRDDVYFSDGSHLDADVLLWNFENFKEKSQTSSTHFGSVDSFEKTGDYTVVIHLNEWNSQIPYSLNSVPGLMYSKKAFDENGEEWCMQNPVGTGPYVLDKWVNDDSKTFKKNENYWNKEATVYLDSVETKVIADEMSAQAALLNGDINAYFGGSTSFQNTMMKAGFERAANKMNYRIYFLIFASDVEGSPLADVKVRQAISYAIDSQSIAENVDYGITFVSKEYAVEGTPFYNDAVKGYDYDAAKAKELLKEAGYENGFTTTIYAGVDQALTSYLIAIQGYLKEVGITLNIEEQETAIWTSKGIYDIDEGMILAGHGFGANLVNQQVSNFSKRAKEGVGMLKECKLHPDDLDNAIMSALQASDTAEMLKYEFQAQEMIIDDYCLGYPVVMSEAYVTMMNKDLVDAHCFANNDSFPDFTGIYFK